VLLSIAVINWAQDGTVRELAGENPIAPGVIGPRACCSGDGKSRQPEVLLYLRYSRHGALT
jgi:hypothetical protein